ncbi:outer membrane lipoprotein carrier protein LolA [bacterium]|nr:MAG: outer membrane lipoprotein carrier protein LolA [bacterium]
MHKNVGKLFVLLVMLITSSGASWAQSKGLELIKKELKNGKALQAELVHTFIDTFTGDTSKSTGKVWIHKNGYRVESDDRIIAVFDSVSTVYSIVKNQVIISPYNKEDDDFAPSRFINATENEYKINEKKEKNVWQIELINLDDFAVFRQILMLVDTKGFPMKITALDQQSNVNESAFTKSSYVSYSNKLKMVDYPESAEIVDLRQ